MSRSNCCFLHTDFSRGRSGRLVFPSLSEFSKERPRGDTPCPRSGATASLRYTGRVEIPNVQGQRNPSKTVSAGSAVRRYPMHKDKRKGPGRRFSSVQFNSVLSRVRIFVTPWITAQQDSLSIINTQSPPEPMSIELVMPSNHLTHCCPFLLLSSIFPRIRVFSNKSNLRIRWPVYWSFSLNISPSNETQEWFPLGWIDWISLQSKGFSRVFSNTIVQKYQFFCPQISL